MAAPKTLSRWISVPVAAAVMFGCVAAVAKLPAAAASRTWNVTPTSSPSLAVVEQQAQPGDTVVLSGRFANTSLLPKVSGTAAAPIVYEAGPAGATFDGPGPSGVAAISGRAYLVFDGIAFTNSNYRTAPVVNKGVIVRSSNHITFRNNDFSYMQMQLIGASDNSILDNTWRQYVAVYNSSGQPETAGDVLSIQGGSNRNEIAGNDMKYGGHSLIEIGDGWGPTNAANWIHDNVLDNPWYKNLILADDGAGTIVENNQLLNANSVPTLMATVPYPSSSRWPKDGKAYASEAVQFSGSNFIVRNNTIDNAVGIYSPIGLGARWYYGQGAPIGGALVESTNNQIYGNTISNCKGAATFSFEQNYTPGTDDSEPQITGNLIHDNTIVNAQPSIYSWDGSSHYETVIFRSFKGATLWTGLDGSQVYDNVGFSSTNAYRYSYVNAANATTTKVYTLAQFEALDPANLYGNS